MRKVLCAVLLGLSLASCSADSGGDPAAVPSYDSLRLPEASVQDMFEARERAIASCMRGRGFDYQPATYIPLPPELARGERRWGPIDAKAVKTDGYHPGRAIRDSSKIAKKEGNRQETMLASYSKERLAAFSLALSGVAATATAPPPDTQQKLPDGSTVKISTAYLPGSCHDVADKQLYGEIDKSVAMIEALRQVVDRMSQSADARAMADETFTDAVEAWSQCFTEHGYDAKDPLVAMDKYAAPGDSPSAEERRAAVADVECKTRTNLWGTWQSVLDREWRKEAAKRDEVVLAYREVQDQLRSTLGR